MVPKDDIEPFIIPTSSNTHLYYVVLLFIPKRCKKVRKNKLLSHLTETLRHSQQ